MPDGEVGERRSWVKRFSYLLFNEHSDLETLRCPPKIDGVEQRCRPSAMKAGSSE
jgi:hypothetical protein